MAGSHMDATFAWYMLGLTVPAGVVTWAWDHAVGLVRLSYNWGTPPTPYSYQIFFIHIYNVSPHSNLMYDWSHSSFIVVSGSRRFSWFCTCTWIMNHAGDYDKNNTSYLQQIYFLYIYNVFQHLLLWLLVIRMQPKPDICLVSQSKWW
jgi:hypothetical protein